MPLSAYQLSPKTIKYITSLAFRIAPTSSSQQTRSLRLLLASLPTKPLPGHASFPSATLTSVHHDADQRVDVTYSDKNKVELSPGNISVADLIRKVRPPKMRNMSLICFGF